MNKTVFAVMENCRVLKKKFREWNAQLKCLIFVSFVGFERIFEVMKAFGGARLG